MFMYYFRRTLPKLQAGYTLMEWLAVISIIMLLCLGMYVTSSEQKGYERRFNKASQTYLDSSPAKRANIRQKIKERFLNR